MVKDPVSKTSGRQAGSLACKGICKPDNLSSVQVACEKSFVLFCNFNLFFFLKKQPKNNNNKNHSYHEMKGRDRREKNLRIPQKLTGQLSIKTKEPWFTRVEGDSGKLTSGFHMQVSAPAHSQLHMQQIKNYHINKEKTFQCQPLALTG